ncbi:MAG: DUF86 domain-containing protein [Acidobacteria bacterium]|nr:DUF86 domain-containing protein [Acidobacteriota bacterium]
MSERGDLECLDDIEEAIRRIERYTKALNYDAFLKDTKTQDAVVRNLEIIGEAVKNISSDFRRRHKQVEWKQIAGLRDQLIHGYFGVNWEIVWSIVKEKIPELKLQVKELLKDAR